MATQVLIAHTGQRLQVDASQFNSYVSLPYPTGLACYFGAQGHTANRRSQTR